MSGRISLFHYMIDWKVSYHQLQWRLVWWSIWKIQDELISLFPPTLDGGMITIQAWDESLLPLAWERPQWHHKGLFNCKHAASRTSKDWILASSEMTKWILLLKTGTENIDLLFLLGQFQILILQLDITPFCQQCCRGKTSWRWFPQDDLDEWEGSQTTMLLNFDFFLICIDFADLFWKPDFKYTEHHFLNSPK